MRTVLGVVAVVGAAAFAGLLFARNDGGSSRARSAGSTVGASHRAPHDREAASLAAMRAAQPGFSMLEGEVSLASGTGAPGRGTFFSERRLDAAIWASATAKEVRLRRVDCVAGRRAADHREFFCGIVFVDGSEGQAIARVSLDGRRWRLGPMRLE